MVKIDFTEEDVVNLRNEMMSHPHPRVQLRMFALLLKAQGLHHKKICEVLGICYSPNLNLIERLWKYVKNQCLYLQVLRNAFFFQSSHQRLSDRLGN